MFMSVPPGHTRRDARDDILQLSSKQARFLERLHASSMRQLRSLSMWDKIGMSPEEAAEK
jgi:hypothetical protein